MGERVFCKARLSKGKWRYCFTRRHCFSIAQSADAHQRKFCSLVVQRVTRRVFSACAPSRFRSDSSSENSRRVRGTRSAGGASAFRRDLPANSPRRIRSRCATHCTRTPKFPQSLDAGRLRPDGQNRACRYAVAHPLRPIPGAERLMAKLGRSHAMIAQEMSTGRCRSGRWHCRWGGESTLRYRFGRSLEAPDGRAQRATALAGWDERIDAVLTRFGLSSFAWTYGHLCLLADTHASMYSW